TGALRSPGFTSGVRMVNMKMSAEEAKEYTQPTPGDAPEYPWGLCISLDEDSIAKLGITSLPAVGSQMQVQALVTVSSTSENNTQSGEKERRVELQITDMELTPAQRSASDRLYG